MRPSRLRGGLRSAGLEKTPHMARRNPLAKAALAGRVGQCARRPRAAGTPRRLRGLTGPGAARAPLLSTAGGRRPWHTLRHRPVWTRQPGAAPPSPRAPAGPQATCDLGGGRARGQQQEKVGTETGMLRRVVGPNEVVQFLAFSFRERHSGWLGTRHIPLLGVRSMMAQKLSYSRLDRAKVNRELFSAGLY